MSGQSSASSSKVFCAGQPIDSRNSGKHNSSPSGKPTLRVVAWVQRAVFLAIALILSGASSLLAQTGALAPITAGVVYGQGGSFTSGKGNKGGVSANSLYGPNGIALDSGGNLYVADSYNSRVLFYPAGSTTATRVYGQGGSFTTGGSNEGGVSAKSSLFA